MDIGKEQQPVQLPHLTPRETPIPDKLPEEITQPEREKVPA